MLFYLCYIYRINIPISNLYFFRSITISYIFLLEKRQKVENLWCFCVANVLFDMIRMLFDIFLVNIDEELRSGVRKRFDEFHAATMQEVARAEAYRKSHRRSPPPILGPQAQRPQELHGK